VAGECIPCPVGAQCKGGAAIRALSGFWRVPAADGGVQSFVECVNPVACLGAPNLELYFATELEPLRVVSPHAPLLGDGAITALMIACVWLRCAIGSQRYGC